MSNHLHITSYLRTEIIMDTDRYSKYLKKRERKINELSARFMNNAKWLKLFSTLSENFELTTKCFIVDIYDDVPREIDIPTQDNFFDTYHETGIKDVGAVCPMLFKEIRWIEFPATWSIPRTMRDETLEPFIFTQNLDLIENMFMKVGELETERDNSSLKIYGYR